PKTRPGWAGGSVLARCRPEEAESFAARRAPEEGPMHFVVTAVPNLPDHSLNLDVWDGCHAMQAAMELTRNAEVLRLLSSRFAGRKTALRMKNLRVRGAPSAI